MHLFIQRQNILYFRRKLAEQQPETQRLQLLKLLAEEEAKPHGDAAPGGPPILP